MSTYSSPSGAVIRGYVRLDGQAFGIADATLETELAAQVTDGEDAVFLRIGESYETNSTLTARQVRCLQRAVAFRTGQTFLLELRTDYAGGTQAPLLMSPEELDLLIAQYEQWAEQWEALVQGEGETVNTRPFSKPAASSSTFTVSSTDRSPAERDALLDETDDLSAQDTANN